MIKYKSRCNGTFLFIAGCIKKVPANAGTLDCCFKGSQIYI